MSKIDNVVALDQWRARNVPTTQDVLRHPSARAEQPKRRDVIDVAIRMLTRKDLTVQEFQQALRRDGYEHGEIASATEMALRDKYLDDVRVAAHAAAHAFDRKLWSDRAVSRALSSRGVSDVDIETALAEINGENSSLTESERAQAVTEKSLRSYRGLEFDVVRRRLSGKLQRRGFSSQAIREMVEFARVELGHDV